MPTPQFKTFDDALHVILRLPILFRAAEKANGNMENIVHEMMEIVMSETADDEDRHGAACVIVEALWPELSDAVCQEEQDRRNSPEGQAIAAELDREELEYIAKVTAKLTEKGMSPEELAKLITYNHVVVLNFLDHKFRPSQRFMSLVNAALDIS